MTPLIGCMKRFITCARLGALASRYGLFDQNTARVEVASHALLSSTTPSINSPHCKSTTIDHGILRSAASLSSWWEQDY